jgi:hypothetical protein
MLYLPAGRQVVPIAAVLDICVPPRGGVLFLFTIACVLGNGTLLSSVGKGDGMSPNSGFVTTIDVRGVTN